MAFSNTQWDIPNQSAVHAAISPQLAVHVANGDTNGDDILTYGPDAGVPAGQYSCRRQWTTLALAQSWCDYVQTIGIPCLGAQATEN